MSSAARINNGMGASFLPEDYRQRKVEGRTGVLMVILFCIVMFGVVAAFYVTNREWAAVRSLQEQINVQYAAEAKKIEQLQVLEAQKSEMVEKAEITTALIEKVPRSILMAELINRMPQALALTELNLVSKKIVDAPVKTDKGKKPEPRSIAGKTPPAPSTAPGKSAAAPKAGGKKEEAAERPKPPRFEYTMTLVGLARTDQDIADFTAGLQQCGLLEKVEFKFSQDVLIDEVSLRKFKIEVYIRNGADAKSIEPLHVQRTEGTGTGSSLERMGEGVMKRKALKLTTKEAGDKDQKDQRPTATVPDKKE